MEIAGNTVARFLGYNCLKSEQRLTVKESVKPRDVLPSCVTKRNLNLKSKSKKDMESHCAILSCLQ